MTESGCALTIAIGTRSRPDYLAQLLDSCAVQQVDDSLIEVLVVLDGKCDESRLIFDRFTARTRQLGRRVRARLVEPWADPRGLAATRNVCADEAAGRWIRFQNDDALLDSNACAAMLGAHARADQPTVILGQTGVLAHLYQLPLMHYLFTAGDALLPDSVRADPGNPGAEWCWGGRASLDTSLVRAERFDETLRFGAEDIEFALRATGKRHVRVAYTPATRSYLARLLEFDECVDRSYRQGRALCEVADRNPGRPIEYWAVNGSACGQSDTELRQAFSRAATRCRRLEYGAGVCGQGVGDLDQVQRTLAAACRETFGLARTLGFRGEDLPHEQRARHTAPR